MAAEKKWRIPWGKLALLTLVLALGGCWWVKCSFDRALAVQTDPALYPKFLSERARGPAYAFLPASIDPHAEAVAYFHVPGFLQGGDIVGLRLRLPQGSIAPLLAALESSGRKEIAASEVPQVGEECYPQFGRVRAGRETMVEGVEKLPADFRVFLFASDLADIDKNWNHNFLGFTAVSAGKREVVYYANHW